MVQFYLQGSKIYSWWQLYIHIYVHWILHGKTNQLLPVLLYLGSIYFITISLFQSWWVDVAIAARGAAIHQKFVAATKVVTDYATLTKADAVCWRGQHKYGLRTLNIYTWVLKNAGYPHLGGHCTIWHN